ncbi:MAG: hypothetical protein MJY55_00330 [Bacteroidales bacterium]|nr:hypothetical protein [Bacteroidales bacterium]
MKKFLFLLVPLVALSCEKVDVTPEPIADDTPDLLELQDVAKMLSSVGLEPGHLEEVHDAVSSSSGNGYDEEYTMKNLFSSPGAGVGEDVTSSAGGETKGSSRYSHPLREALSDYLSSVAKSRSVTKGGKEVTVQDYIEFMSDSDMQVYWPYSDEWDGETMPVITFDPMSEVSSNVGYTMAADGTLDEVYVTEEMARQRPVWVINRNDDAGYVSLEKMRRDNPEWSQGGSLVIGGGTGSKTGTEAGSGSGTKVPYKVGSAPLRTSSDDCKTLVLKDFTMLRQYDCWLAGASEFFCKIGAVESFTASTEAEMYLYNPSITDFMVVLKRNQVGIAHELNTVLVSEWTGQFESAAFLLTEDDGGTITTWSCSAMVKCNSKSYGFEIKIPFNSRDDIVWRGMLSRKYIESSDTVTGHFGDVVLTFEIK